MHFQDESRDIASEYKGGADRYAHLERSPPPQLTHDDPFDFAMGEGISGPSGSQQPLPPIQPLLPSTYAEQGQVSLAEAVHDGQFDHAHSTSDSGDYSGHNLRPPSLPSSYGNQDQRISHTPEIPNYLTSPEEVLIMQVFVEEVGLWMDSMDAMKHVRNPCG